MVKCILQKGRVSINAVNTQKKTALMLALTIPSAPVLERLLYDHRVNPSVIEDKQLPFPYPLPKDFPNQAAIQHFLEVRKVRNYALDKKYLKLPCKTEADLMQALFTAYYKTRDIECKRLYRTKAKALCDNMQDKDIHGLFFLLCQEIASLSQDVGQDAYLPLCMMMKIRLETQIQQIRARNQERTSSSSSQNAKDSILLTSLPASFVTSSQSFFTTSLLEPEEDALTFNAYIEGVQEVEEEEEEDAVFFSFGSSSSEEV
jgi:hypothetical protein